MSLDPPAEAARASQITEAIIKAGAAGGAYMQSCDLVSMSDDERKDSTAKFKEIVDQHLMQADCWGFEITDGILPDPGIDLLFVFSQAQNEASRWGYILSMHDNHDLLLKALSGDTVVAGIAASMLQRRTLAESDD